jgi:uncharacterized protein CbrC (UPF0167 family)
MGVVHYKPRPVTTKALINGEVVEYDMCSKDRDAYSGDSWKANEYLGKGVAHSYNGSPASNKEEYHFFRFVEGKRDNTPELNIKTTTIGGKSITKYNAQILIGGELFNGVPGLNSIPDLRDAVKECLQDDEDFKLLMGKQDNMVTINIYLPEHDSPAIVGCEHVPRVGETITLFTEVPRAAPVTVKVSEVHHYIERYGLSKDTVIDIATEYI